MKAQRFRAKLVALLLFSLFALLAVYGLYAIDTYGNRWFAYAKNPRVREQKRSVIPGDIYDRNAVLLATTVDGQRVYQSSLSARRAIVHVIGDPEGQVANGVEGFQTAYLYGFKSTLAERINALGSTEPRRGDDVHLTLDSALCTAIPRYFDSHPLSAGKNGAAVVMNYLTGEVIASVSLPGFDPMDASGISEGSEVYWNRATQSLYPPGSTFKIITTAAALEALPNAAVRNWGCTGAITVENHVIRCFGGARHGDLTLRQAFVQSCNNVYAMLALDMGDAALRKTAERFGFNANFLFRDLVVENSAYPTTGRNGFEVAMSGFGQSAIGMTPLHMCLMASAVANDGVMMEPRLLLGATSPTGAARGDAEDFAPRTYRTAMSAEVASTLQEYMRAVVTGGTGRSAAVDGMTICGKTGSAETTRNGWDVTHGLFVGYCADRTTPYAVAVVVENIAEGEGGGSTAAPIARDIFTYIKNNYQGN